MKHVTRYDRVSRDGRTGTVVHAGSTIARVIFDGEVRAAACVIADLVPVTDRQNMSWPSPTGDPEHVSRIEAQRVTLEFGSRSRRRVDAGRRPIEESPLFGGPAQEDLFDGPDAA
jgi:hypothetical protein